MKGIPNQSAASLPAYGSRTGDIRILFVEDDEYYREALGADLSERGFVVHSFADATSFLGALDSAAEADVIILDWKLPKTSGIDLLPQLRRRGVNLPVVFLTGHVLTANESLAFDRGATDFIDKARGIEGAGQAPEAHSRSTQACRRSPGRAVDGMRQAFPQAECQPGLLGRRGSRPYHR